MARLIMASCNTIRLAIYHNWSRVKSCSEADKENIAQGIISGIQHLHSNNIVHRDLKSANILIAEGYQGGYVPKIADFGLSKQFTENEKSYFSNSFRRSEACCM
ncbi:MAG: protein kinase [Saprospiraceae bacterium]|nr:protein kinase [Saprospiraceae bacterium]